MIIGTRVNSDRFEYAAGRFLADAAELQHSGLNLFSQIWDDSADAGFVMVSARTGNEMPFYHEDTEKNIDGDILSWKFRSQKKDANGRFMTAIVFND